MLPAADEPTAPAVAEAPLAPGLSPPAPELFASELPHPGNTESPSHTQQILNLTRRSVHQSHANRQIRCYDSALLSR